MGIINNPTNGLGYNRGAPFLMDRPAIKVGVIGTGFIANGFAKVVQQFPDIDLTSVLTRRPPSQVEFYHPDVLTDSVDELIEKSDMVVECTGDVIYGTSVLEKVLAAGRKVVTMNAELQVTTGSWLAQKGFFTEANGDQPGVIANLREVALGMGLKPVVYGNIKGFLNENPSHEDMEYWSEKQGIRTYQTTSFTDGTKVEYELALVANAFGAHVLPRQKHGLKFPSLEDGAHALGRAAIDAGIVTSDYVMAPGAPAGVFLTCTTDADVSGALQYFKLGAGPTYVLVHNTHLCFLEIPSTIRRVAQGGGILLNNGVNPPYSVGTIAKRDLDVNEVINHGVGSYEVRGEVVETQAEPEHVPLGLVHGAVLRRPVRAGDIIREDDLGIPESRAAEIWQSIKESVLNHGSQT